MPAVAPFEPNHLLDYRPRGFLLAMSPGDRAALLSELLAEPPSERIWNALLELFVAWPEDADRGPALSAALVQLEGWPEALRTVSSAKGYLYRGKGLADLARLARSIALYRRDREGSREAIAIAGSPHVQRLTALNVVRCELDSQAWQALLCSVNLGSLRQLSIARCTLGEHVTRQLLQTAAFPALQSLILEGVGLTAERLGPVRQVIPFARLDLLDLSANPIGDAGADVLAQAPWLQGIRWLALREAFLSARSVKILLDSPRSRALCRLDISGNPLESAARAGLLTLAGGRGIELIL